MANAITQDMPVGEIVKSLVPPGTAAAHLPVHIDKVALTAEASPANGGMFSWQNPLGVKALATVVLEVTTPATGAANADVGTDGDGTGSSDDLLDGVDIGTAADVFTPFTDAGTNGTPFKRLDEAGGTTDYITGTASADSSGLVGFAYIIYFPIDE